MPLYARSDVVHIAIPAESGGCGASHARPVLNGAPAKIWRLSCPACETYLRDDIERSTYEMTDRDGKKHTINNSTWGTHELKIPKTPDEARIADDLEKEGKQSMAAAFQGVAGSLIADRRLQDMAAIDAAMKAEEAARADQRVAQLETELAEMRALVQGIAGSVHKPVDDALAASTSSTAPKQPAVSRGISKPVMTVTPREKNGKIVPPIPSGSLADPKSACSSCGGSLRAPGSKGPTPKGTCLACRAKARSRVA